MPQRTRPTWWVAAAAAATFVLMAVAVAARGALPGDVVLLEAVTDAAGTRFDGAARLVGDLTDPAPLLVAAAAAVAALLLAGRRRGAALLVAGLGVALAVNPWLKDLVDRPRPTVRVIPEPVSPRAFPAGHAANTAALAGGLLLAVPRRAVGAVAVAGAALLLATAASRLVVGAHHPSDLVAGWLWVGTVVALLWPARSAT
ncbi:MAG: phosphatase PAP2 family protein [Actinomycetota bacterium]